MATNRRKFVAGAAALGVAPFISTRVTRALAAASGKKLGFALCGLGSLSTNQIAPAFQNTEHCRLAGIITGTPPRRQNGKRSTTSRIRTSTATRRCTGLPTMRTSMSCMS